MELDDVGKMAAQSITLGTFMATAASSKEWAQVVAPVMASTGW